MGDIVRKVYDVEVRGINAETGEVDIFIPMSTGSRDRDNEVVLPNAFKKRLASYKKRPILVSSHTYGDIRKQIGMLGQVKVTDEGFMGKPRYYINEGNPEADWGFFLAKEGVAAYSIGFIPHEWEEGDGEKQPRRTYTDVELLEVSHVIVPSNRDAIQAMQSTLIAKGVEMPGEFAIALEDALEAVRKPEETENYIRIPVKGEEGKHDDHRIRTINIDKDKGIKALYCGECKKNITYLFDKEKDWTMESAQEWVDEHSKGIENALDWGYVSGLFVAGFFGEVDKGGDLISTLSTGSETTQAEVKETLEERKKDISQAEIKDEFDYVQTIIEADDLSDDNTASAWDIVREFMRITGGDIPDDILAKLGAVLNQKNRQALKDAQAKIQTVLDSAGAEPEEPEKEAVDPTAIAREVAIAFKAQLDERMGIVH